MPEWMKKRHILYRSIVWHKLFTKKKRWFNLESHLGFLDYVKASDRVKRDKLSEKLQRKIIPSSSLKV